MQRQVSASMTLDASDSTHVVLSVAVARGLAADECLTVTQNGAQLGVTECLDQHGTRLHILDAQAGRIEVSYTATIEDHAEPVPVEELDRVRYLRPSRYCESDTLAAVAAAEFEGLTGAALLRAVTSWVSTRLTYDGASTDPTDGAVATLLSRRGVCRDFAHLVVALLRACDVPARLVSVYAPGLRPMDFHAVAEALIDGRWLVVDATGLAPRESLVRIATGRDAADTAFLTTIGGIVTLQALSITATADALPADDPSAPVALS